MLRENPRLLLGLALWLLGYSRFDVHSIVGVDLEEAARYGVIVDEFGDVVKVRDAQFRRFSKDSVERLVGECLDVEEIFSMIVRLSTEDEKKTLIYVSDYVRRRGCFSIYGVSDYIRCSELLQNINVEYRVLCTVLKFLVYSCDRTYSCTEYTWTRALIEKIQRGLTGLVKLPTDDDIKRSILSLLVGREDGIRIIAAMYSMSTGSIDQFSHFHKRPVQDYIKSLTSIRYVFYDGFLNGLALPLIERVLLEHVIEPLLRRIVETVGASSLSRVDESRAGYIYTCRLDNQTVLIAVPKMYYFSPIFWALPEAINVVYELPHNVDSYVSLYRPYFEKGILVLSRGLDVKRVIYFGDSSPLSKLAESLSCLARS